MLAPIALYPDAVLSQILMAATYPLEIVRAARWAGANPALKGDAAVQAVGDKNWDASVKSMVAFPQLLQTMDQKIDWTERLGDAFLAQQSQVMDTVQTLRQKAQQAGNLASNTQIGVTQSDNAIIVAAADPNLLYAPYYDPAVVYGSWWWPDYPPVYWSPWAGYGWNNGLAWGLGIGIGAGFLIGSWDWHNHRFYGGHSGHSGDGQPWHHDPGHRRGVPYRDASLNRQFGRPGASPFAHAGFRGHEPSSDARPGPAVNRGLMQSVPRANLVTPGARSAIAPGNGGRPFADARPHAFDNVGRGADVRTFSARGQSSFSGRSQGGFSGRSPGQAPSGGGARGGHGGGSHGGAHR